MYGTLVHDLELNVLVCRFSSASSSLLSVGSGSGDCDSFLIVCISISFMASLLLQLRGSRVDEEDCEYLLSSWVTQIRGRLLRVFGENMEWMAGSRGL